MNDKPKVLGKYVYIDIPVRPDKKFKVDDNTKKAVEIAFLEKLDRLQIWAVGDTANTKLKEGQWVLIDPEAIRNNLKMVPFNFDGEKVYKGLILDYHIVHIWP